MLAPQEVQQLVVDVPGALLLRPVAAVGQEDDPAQVRDRRLHRLELPEEHRGVTSPADQQGRLPHAGRPNLWMLVPVAVLVAVHAERPAETGRGVRPGVLVEVRLAEPARQLAGSGILSSTRPDGARSVNRRGTRSGGASPESAYMKRRMDRRGSASSSASVTPSGSGEAGAPATSSIWSRDRSRKPSTRAGRSDQVPQPS